MAFGIGEEREITDAGRIRGKQVDIACECWFTAGGRSRPVLIKYMDEDGEIRSVRPFQVHYMEEKNYAGVPTAEYACTICVNGIAREVKLVFFKETLKWIMVV